MFNLEVLWSFFNITDTNNNSSIFSPVCYDDSTTIKKMNTYSEQKLNIR